MRSFFVLSAVVGGGGVLDVIPFLALFMALLLITYFGLSVLLRPLGVLSLVPAMLCGVLFGKTILGNIMNGWHFGSVLELNSNLGICMTVVCAIAIGFLLFESGLKTSSRLDWKNLRKNSHLILSVGLGASICIFIITIFIVSFFLSLKGAIAIAALTMIAAVVTIAAILKDLGIRCSEEADPIFAICAMNEIVSWIIINSVISFYSGNVDIYGGILFPAISTLIATGGSLLFGRDMMNIMFSRVQKKKDKLILLFILMAAFVYIFSLCGIGFLYAFFLVGLLFGKPGTIPEDVRDIAIELLVTIFVPIFFMNVVLQFDLFEIDNWLMITAIIGYFFIIKGAVNYAFAYLSTRSAWFSAAIAIALIPGGAIEISVARVFQQIGIMDESVFFAIIVHVLVSALLCGNILRAHLKLKKLDLEMYFTSKYIFACGKRKYLWAESHTAAQWHTVQDEFLKKLAETLVQYLRESDVIVQTTSVYISLKDNSSNWIGRKVRGRYLVFTCDLPEITQTWIIPVCMNRLQGIKVEEGDEDEILHIFVILCPLESGSLSLTSNIGAMIKSQPNRARILGRYDEALGSIQHGQGGSAIMLSLEQISE